MVNAILPPNSTPLERGLEAATKRLSAIPYNVHTLNDPATCPANVLPFLAYALSVDTWDHTWPEKTKRKVVAAAIAVHRVKGTLGAVLDALKAVDMDADVSEWFQHDGTPYTFKIDINLFDKPLTRDDLTLAITVIENAKNTRSHLDAITIHLANRSDAPKLASALISSQKMTIYPYQIPEFTHHTDTPHIGATIQFLHDLTILPQGTH
jgi:phage tail P2-like protein